MMIDVVEVSGLCVLFVSVGVVMCVAVYCALVMSVVVGGAACGGNNALMLWCSGMKSPWAVALSLCNTL